MATLYVENIPDDLYKALRGRARGPAPLHRRGGPGTARRKHPHSARVEGEAGLATQTHPHARKSDDSKSSFPSTEEMLREDRER